MEELFLWRFYLDCGRSGSLVGLFVASEYDVEQAIGKEVYFGEVLGKHSEVYAELGEHHFSKVDLDSQTVMKVKFVLGRNWSGFNPLEYVRNYCEECGERLEYGEWCDCECTEEGGEE